MEDSKEVVQITNKSTAAKWIAIAGTVLYTILYPAFVYFAFMSFIIFHAPRITIFAAFLVIFFTFLIPLSMPLSIYLMWTRYLRGQYKKIKFAFLLPVFYVLGMFLVFMILGGLQYVFTLLWI